MLETKLNKYLIKIINEYSDIEKLITTYFKTRVKVIKRLKSEMTTEDVIIKSIQWGYKGFYIDYFDDNLIFSDKIDKYCGPHDNYYSFINDKRTGLSFININNLNVFDYIYNNVNDKLYLNNT